MEEIIIRVLKIEDVKKYYQQLCSCLTDKQLNRIKHYTNEKTILSTIGVLYLIQKYTNQNPLRYNKYGKPMKSGEFFNAAHSGDYIIFAKSKNLIGIDIEKIRPYKEKLLEYLCNKQDREQVKTIKNFYTMWTQKESVIKCLGTGLAKGNIKDVPAFPIGNKEYQNIKYTTTSDEYNDHIISVCVKGNKEFCVKLDLLSFSD